MGRTMRRIVRPRTPWANGALSALLIALAALLISQAPASAQRPLIDPRSVSLKLADLPRGFTVVESETATDQLRVGQGPKDVVGVSFKTAMERPRTLENLQTGPFRVAQIVARSDDPTRAVFSLDAQREFNVREHGYEVADSSDACDGLLCLVRRDGPFHEYRIVAVKDEETLISTTTVGLASAVNLDGAVALTKLSLSRYDEQSSEVIASQPSASGIDAEFRAVATATPTQSLPPPPPPPAATKQPPAAPASSSTSDGKLPPQFDNRLAKPWSELMSSSATTKSGEKMPAFLRRVVEESKLEVSIGDLRPNVGGELRAVATVDGDKAKVIERAITINKDVVNESPRVLAAMLAHEITHANQPVVRSGGKPLDCLEAEVEAYAMQAHVWGAFWGDSHRPGETKWERSMNYIEEVWKDGGEAGLRHLIREEIDTDAHSCIG
jgi:hypothetical protein